MGSQERTPLSRQRIANSALVLIGDVGLQALSMRKLGSALGVEAMSLYHYVSNKDDLLDAVLDQLYDQIRLPQDIPMQDWEQAIRLALRSFYGVVLENPQSLELFVSRPGRSLSAFRVLHWSHERFRGVGLDVMEAGIAFRFCVSFVIGHSATETGSLGQARKAMQVDTSVIEDEEFALFVNQSEQLTPEVVFEAGLDMLIAGLRTRFDLD